MFSLETNFKLCFFLHYLFGGSRGRFVSIYYKEQLLLSDEEVGVILSISHILRMTAAPLWGYIADKLCGRRIVYATSIMASALLFATNQFIVWYYLDDHQITFKLALLCRFLQSIFTSISFSLIDAEILAVAKLRGLEENQSRQIWGRARVYGAVGWAISNSILGIALDQVKTTALLIPSTLFLGTLTTAFAWAVFLPFKDYHPKKDTSNTITTSMALSSFRRSFCSNVEGVVFLMVVLLSASGMILVEGLSFLFFSEELHLSFTMLGFLVIITILFELPLFHYSSDVMQYFGFDVVILIGLIAYSTRVFIYTILPSSKGYMIVGIEWLHGVTIGTISSARVLKFQEFTPEGYESTFQAILNSVVGTGFFLGEFIGGHLFQTVGKRGTYRLSALMIIMTAVAHILSSSQIRKFFYRREYTDIPTVELS